MDIPAAIKATSRSDTTIPAVVNQFPATSSQTLAHGECVVALLAKAVALSFSAAAATAAFSR